MPDVTPLMREVDRYMQDVPNMAFRLVFFKDLWSVQEELAAAAPEWTPPSAETMEEALATGQTIFSIDAPPVDAETFAASVSRVAESIAGTPGLPPQASTALREKDLTADLAVAFEGQGLGDVASLLDALARSVDIDESELPTPILDFVFSSALTPSASNAAAEAIEALGDFEWPVWGRGTCPVCGTPASWGRIADEGELQGGHRTLSCPVCRAEWGFDRLRCARCGSRDHTALHNLYDEEDPGHKAHACDACHGYLKVSDERELGRRTVGVVEEVVMVPLDTVAAARGYTTMGDGESSS
jgi:FdhE protein